MKRRPSRRLKKKVVERSVSSLQDFIKTIKRLRGELGEDLWFRGQANARHDLKPRTYRSSANYEDEAEDENRYDFQRGGVQFFAGRLPSSHWEWYFLMQHYGLPTRLLDWTEGALLALYFALRFHKGRTDAAVWVLAYRRLQEYVVGQLGALPPRRNREYRFIRDYLPDPEDERTAWIRAYLPTEFSEEKLPRLPAPIRPPHIDRRIAVQFSVFTVHGSIHRGLERVARESTRPCLAKIRIPRRFVKTVSNALEVCGIDETTIFPDLDGLARELSKPE